MVLHKDGDVMTRPPVACSSGCSSCWQATCVECHWQRHMLRRCAQPRNMHAAWIRDLYPFGNGVLRQKGKLSLRGCCAVTAPLYPIPPQPPHPPPPVWPQRILPSSHPLPLSLVCPFLTGVMLPFPR